MSETNTQENPGGPQGEGAPRCMCGGTGPTLSRLVEALIPTGEAGAHFRQAQLEMLKGLRAVLDHRIETMSQPSHGTRLNVD
jgi:hypothetical protein